METEDNRSPATTAVADPTTLPPVALSTGAIVLRKDQLPRAQSAVDALDFSAIAPGDIINMGLDAERALQGTLDGFLARLDKNTSAKLFELFGRLEKGVAEADLPDLLKRLHEGDKPGFFEGIFAKLGGKSADQAMREFMDEIGALITGRTQTLASRMQQIEGELSGEMQKLFGELKSLEQLKQAYATHFSDFTVAAGAARAFLDKAKTYVAAEQAKLQVGDVAGQTRLRELEDKLRLLESRALALEGTYTRLPADQIVIQQIEQAGVATLQETATTIASRFASIKMTLLSIHGAFAVKSVQQLSERQARLDEQLQKVRTATVKDVAVAAAAAPGDNRLRQAQQIEDIVTATKEIHAMIETAKRQSDEKFATARQKFAQARQELAALT